LTSFEFQKLEEKLHHIFEPIRKPIGYVNPRADIFYSNDLNLLLVPDFSHHILAK